MHHYLKTLLLFMIVPFSVMVLFNLLVDPYGSWHGIRIHGINALKPEMIQNERIAKMGIWARYPTANLILGSSCAAEGLDPDHNGFSGVVNNLAVSGMALDEAKQLLYWVVGRKQIKQVVFGSDFFSANMLYEADLATIEKCSTFEGRIAYVALLKTFISSFRTVYCQYNHDIYKSYLNSRNLSRVSFSSFLQNYHHHFQDSDSGFINLMYLRGPAFQFSFSAKGKSAEGYYRQIFAMCHLKDIDLRVFISPSHVRHLEVVYAMGLWPLQEEWIRIMVRVNEEEAAKAGKPPFPLWDFSGFNSLTTEEVPALVDTETQMKWHSDSVHYKKELGDLVLDRILDYKATNRKVLNDFGVLLNSTNLEAHLNQVREDRDAWRKSHPEDVKEIADMAAKAEANRAFLLAKKTPPR